MSMEEKDKRLVVIIMDGWGWREDEEGNCIKQAKTPNFDFYWENYPHCLIEASGLAVGLPEGQQGTSEVNHSIIGAGRVVYQDLVRISKAIEDGSFFENKVLKEAVEFAKKNDSFLHILGLVGPGGVHAHSEHIYGLLELCRRMGWKRVFLHCFTDGRDTLPESGIGYLKEMEEKTKELGVGKIATVCGRYFAMDRDHNWERTDKAYNLLTKLEGKKFQSVEEAMRYWYKQGITDEFIEPTLIEKTGFEGIKEKEAVIFANFRNDRPRQLTERFLERGPKEIDFVTMTQYSSAYKVKVAFPPIEVKNVLGEVISKAGLRQLRVTETEKFAHLTFFLNYKRNDPFEGEDRIMLDSYSDIKTHDERPEMRAADIAREVVQDIKVRGHQVIFTNICNCDMVGHTGNLPAIVKGVEAVDRAVGEIVQAAGENGYEVIITADHGNAEEKIDKDGNILTQHTTNPVPFILISNRFKKLLREKGEMQDVAPTILKILGIEKPKEMTGESLV